MADVWFRKLGFGRNPFAIKPAAFSYELFGPDIKGVLSGIEDGKVLFVEAPLGHGKTTLLKGIINRFGGRRKVVYAHAVPSQNIEVKELLKRASLANVVTGRRPSCMVLVVDEAQNLMEASSAQIMEFYKSGNIRAVVFFGTSYQGSGFAGELKAMMNGNLVRLSRPTPEQAVSIVRSRIGSLSLLSNEVILMAYRKAQGNPRRMLQICEDMCRAAIEEGKLSVSPSKILEVPPFPEKEETAVRKDDKAIRKKSEISSRKKAAARLFASSVFHKPAVVEPVTYVSSTSESALRGIGVETGIVPAAAAIRSASKLARKSNKPKKVSKSAKAAKSKVISLPKEPKGSQAKQAKGRKKTKLLKPLAKPSGAADAGDSSNEAGHYWGEFMGMQK